MVSNTNELIYDLDKHKYYVTPLGIKNRLNIDLKTDLGEEQSSGLTEETVFIRQCSDRVYRWLYWYIRPQSKRIIEKWIADDVVMYGTPFREAMEEALYSQIEYMINFDGDMEAIADGDMTKLVSVESRNILREAGVANQGTINTTVSNDEWRVGY